MNASEPARLLGFFIGSSVSGDITMVPLSAGLTVLYGRNGAGKTRSLAAIQDFFDGRSSSVMGLVELPSLDPAETVEDPVYDPEYGLDLSAYESDYRRGLMDGTSPYRWWIDWGRSSGVAISREAEGLPARSKFEEAVSEFVLKSTESHEGTVRWIDLHVEADKNEALLDEWRQRPMLLVRPIGRGDTSAWESYPAFVTGPDKPAVALESRIWDALTAEFAETDESDDWGCSSLSRIGQLPDGEHVFVGAPYGSPPWEIMYGTAVSHSSLLALDFEIERLPALDNLDAFTAAHLERAIDGELFDVVDGRAVASDRLLLAAAELQARANETYSAVLVDAPRLALNVEANTLSNAVHWRLEPTTHHLPAVELDELSAAQSRWAIWSIQQSFRAEADSSQVIILDEPESALHRSAEAHMARALAKMATENGDAIVVASHSPELLDAPRTFLINVTQSANYLKPLYSRLGPIESSSLADLGLLPSDLLRRQRGFLLVEGQHDAIVMAELLGDELRDLRIDVLILRGALQLSAAKARFLFDFTDAQVFVMLDNLQTDHVARGWVEAKDQFLISGPERAHEVLHGMFTSREIESKVMREFLGASIDSGRINRVTPHGLSRADIIEYLPVNSFVEAGSWEDLRAEHANAQHESPKFRDFKSWLSKAKGADFTDAAITAAVHRLDHIPKDFVRLLKTIEAVTDNPQPDGNS